MNKKKSEPKEGTRKSIDTSEILVEIIIIVIVVIIIIVRIIIVIILAKGERIKILHLCDHAF